MSGRNGSVSSGGCHGSGLFSGGFWQLTYVFRSSVTGAGTYRLDPGAESGFTGVMPEDDILDATARIPEHVALRAFEVETLLLNLETGTYHGLNATGARMIEALQDSGGDVRRSLDRLVEGFDARPEVLAEDLTRLCRELADRGLLEIVPR